MKDNINKVAKDITNPSVSVFILIGVLMGFVMDGLVFPLFTDVEKRIMKRDIENFRRRSMYSWWIFCLTRKLALLILNMMTVGLLGGLLLCLGNNFGIANGFLKPWLLQSMNGKKLLLFFGFLFLQSVCNLFYLRKCGKNGFFCFYFYLVCFVF